MSLPMNDKVAKGGETGGIREVPAKFELVLVLFHVFGDHFNMIFMHRSLR